MKDAKGHGSEARGGAAGSARPGMKVGDVLKNQAAHQAGVSRLGPTPRAVSQKALDVVRGTPPGQGFSVTPGGRQPTGGYMVSLPGRTQSLDAADLAGPNARGILNSYAATHADVFANPAMHYGGWNDPDTHKMSLDPSENIMSRSAAVAAGVARNQKEIWDVKNKVGIKTGGTGK